MSDLLSVLPAFPLTAFTHNIVSNLENHSITTTDLLTLDNLEVSRRTGISLLDLRRFTAEVIKAMHHDLNSSDETAGVEAQAAIQRSYGIGDEGFKVCRCQYFLSTGDSVIDRLLGGGLMLGCISEFVGESGVGKTQILLQLCVVTQLPQSLGGLGRSAVYISTESSLPTIRLVQMIASFQEKFAHSLDSPESLSTDNVLCITCGDLESQEHILNYQLPVVVEKYDVGLIVLDSVAANFRAEYERNTRSWSDDAMGRAAKLAQRGKELVHLGQTLRNLARVHNLAVVVANQVSDRFETQMGQVSNDVDVMTLDYQSRWFTGWGDEDSDEAFDGSAGAKKLPALGLVWANCIAARIVLLKAYGKSTPKEPGGWSRRMKVVYTPWVEGGRHCDYVIVASGVKGIEES